MRSHLRTLTETGVLVRRRRNAFQGTTGYELSAAGQDFWKVAEILRAWLALGPDGPLTLASTAATSAIKALTRGWDTNIVRALAARSLTLTELDSIITGINYPSVERRVGAMRTAGQIKRAAGGGRGSPYSVTLWLRRAVAPIAVAAHWERDNVAAETAPIARLDIEAAFLLTTPLLKLPADLSGSCRLAVEVQTANGGKLAGVVVGVEEGRVVSCAANLQGNAGAWASGSAPAWLRAVIEQDTESLELGGDPTLARAVVAGLHEALFAASQRR